uniref:Endoplasmic reticulum metallopeptidase 1-like n=1 Tax=Tetraselmis sp. GSL018 TaxID=582737 RepID=A0A061S918_9CHLO|mmetsp:Transcript_31722/g.75338  ORF Transcript_31722/g.75338 Transcript_31722/m.75338 type:complete len:888 (-) Transcript_31722:137-2800(-)
MDESSLTPSSGRECLRQRRSVRENLDPTQLYDESADTKGFTVVATPGKTSAAKQQAGPRLALITHAATVAGLALVVVYVALWCPKPVPLDGPAHLFSEGRALEHVRVLTEQIGERQVSTQGLSEAVEYIHGKMLEIVHLARERSDIVAEISTQTVSGAVNMVFLREEITNVYHKLPNLALRISPADAVTEPAVLVCSHVDSTIGSTGASDAASLVGIILEMGRLIVESKRVMLHGPIVLLVNGGEETLSQAAHGFITKHPWASGLGAFINLESGGTHGLDVMFQSTGDWTAKAYGRSARAPRASVMAQDVFMMGMIPADTDYRMFSAQHYGNLPGIDVAFVFGAHQYHTYQDKLENIPAGTVQLMGMNAMAAALEFTKMLRYSKERVVLTDNTQRGHVFFDILSTLFVSYSAGTALVLHNVPVLLLALLVATQRWARPWEMILEALVCSASFVGSIFAAALAGALRVFISGMPLSWFGHWWLPVLIYIPAAVAGVFSPKAFLQQMLFPNSSAASSEQRNLLGASLLTGAVSAVFSYYRIGSAYLFCAWSLGLLAAAAGTHLTQTWRWHLAATTGAIALPLLLSLQISSTWLVHVWQKISMGGTMDSPAGVFVSDYIAGALTGALTWLLLLGSVPVLASHRRMALRIAGYAAAISAAASLLACCFSPYTPESPKRVFIQHYHQHDHLGRILDSSWTVASMDSVPVEAVLAHPSLQGYTPGSSFDWLSFYPLGKILQTVTIPAPPPELSAFPSQFHPQLRQKSLKQTELGDWRLEVHVVLPHPGLGAMKIWGHISRWSFTDRVAVPIPPQPGSNAPEHRIVRFAGHKGSHSWSFWLEVPRDTSMIHIQLAVMFPKRTQAQHQLLEKLPQDVVSPVVATTFASNWTFLLG